MKMHPATFYQQIEFDKILELTSSKAFNAVTRNKIVALEPSTDYEQIRLSLDEVENYVQTVQDGQRYPFYRFEEISESLRMLAIQDYVLDIEEIVKIGNQLQLSTSIRQWANSARVKSYASIATIIKDIPDTTDLLKYFQRIFTKEGEVRPDASSKLVQISNEIESNGRRLNSAFDRVIRKYKDKQWLAESIESYRNGRRVLSVKAEYKRKVTGIIHGESNGGRIYYVEPDDIVPLNNEQFELENQRRKEIYKILKALCDGLRSSIQELGRQFEILVQLDMIRAKGELAIQLDMQRPNLVDAPRLKMLEVRHPLLWLKNSETGQPVVPFDIHLHGNNHLLLISGPNAGGKSITLKAMGLCQLMVQCGFLVPAHENSEFGIFRSFFSDIGDQQSIDESLSTYSSRLQNMNSILTHATKESLIIIDEFGSGTDPILGAALAESILNQFVRKRLWGIITTHYSNLKIFAFKTKGIVNAGMLFDEETLNPTYHLKIGKPGNSYAFEIAQKTGLSEHVLKYARKKAGKNNLALEKMLTVLEADQKKASNIALELTNKEERLDRLIRNYEQLKSELDLKRRKFKLEQREMDFNYEDRLKAEVDRLTKQMKALDAKKVLEQKKQDIKQKQEQIVLAIHELEEEVFEQESGQAFIEELKLGDFVRITKSGLIGKVMDISRSKVKVEVGNMTLETKLSAIAPAKEPVSIKKGKSVTTDVLTNTQTFKANLDIRGQSMNEAKSTLRTFFDEALLSNSYQLKILHGKGSGVLKTMVKSVAAEYKDIRELYHPPREQGGEGVTIVKF